MNAEAASPNLSQHVPRRQPSEGARSSVSCVWLAALVGLLGMGLHAGCGKKSQAASRPPPAPTVRAEPTPTSPSQPVWEPQVRVKLPPPQEIPAEALPPYPTQPEPPTPAPAQRREPRRAANPQPPAAPVARESEPAPAPPAVAAPQLGQILPEPQRREYNRLIDAGADATNRNLALILTKTLTTEQSASVRRIRAFLRQAEEARSQDLALAKNLADRAQLLSEDLARAVR